MKIERLCVDHGNFTRIDVDEFFNCRVGYRILKYEHIYNLKGVKN